jgi:tRNA(Arg) A34 adenosine deaminase TadA
MNRKIWTYLEIAAKLAKKRNDRRHFFLGAIGIRTDGTLVKSPNGHPLNVKIHSSHAEFRVSKKLDTGSEIYVARIRKEDGTMAMAKPCRVCQIALKSAGVKKVYYSIGPKEYGIMIL